MASFSGNRLDTYDDFPALRAEASYMHAQRAPPARASTDALDSRTAGASTDDSASRDYLPADRLRILGFS
ncbi:MAG: hypothetical protein ABI382_03820 [Nakamurella sp.]